MARSNTGSTSNYFQVAGAPVTAVPCTLVCWANLANITGGFALLNVGDDNADEYFALAAEGGVGGDPIRAEIGTSNGTGSRNVDSAGGFSANTWTHCAAVFTSIGINGTTVYINGVGTTGPASTSGTPSGINQTTVAAYEAGGGVFGPLNGLIAEPAIYNAALTAGDILQLSKGFSPELVRPDALVWYAPLFGRHSPEPDLWGGLPLTMTGTMSQAAHPRIFYPTGFVPGVPPAAAGGASAAGSASFSFAPAGVGASSSTAPGSSAVTFAASATGAAAFPGVGASAFAFAASATGTSAGAGVGSAAVAFSPTAAGQSAATSAGAGAVAFSPAGVGASAATSVGASAVAFSPTATGRAATAGAGSTTVFFDVSGLAPGGAAGEGSAAVTFSASAVGQSTTTAAGSSAVAFDGTGVGAATTTGAGTSAFTLAGLAVGNSLAAAAGSATVTFAANGVYDTGEVLVTHTGTYARPERTGTYARPARTGTYLRSPT